MEKIYIAVADSDEFYLKQLANCIFASPQPFEVFTFSRQDSLERFLRQDRSSVDILLISEEMRCSVCDSCSAGTKILLSESEEETEGYGAVKKYQKTASLLSEVMLLYGKNAGKLNRLMKDGRETCLLGLWSPAGGSGKTTLALLLARQLGLMRRSVFYLNCERVDSTRGLLVPDAGISVSDLLVAVRSGESGIGLSVLSKMCTPPRLAFSYINPPESSLEYNEVTAEQQAVILEELEGRFDFVILDFESELNEEKLEILHLCDHIILPFTPDALGVGKLLRFFDEAALRGELASFSGKILYAANKMAGGGDDYLRRRGIYQKCRPAAALPLCGELANLEATLQGGYDASGILSGLTEILLAEKGAEQK